MELTRLGDGVVESVERREIPVRPISVMAAEATSDLVLAIDKLIAYKVPVVDGGRLRNAKTVLEDAARTGLPPSGDRGLQLLINALVTAYDFSDIADDLRPRR